MMKTLQNKKLFQRVEMEKYKKNPSDHLVN